MTAAPGATSPGSAGSGSGPADGGRSGGGRARRGTAGGQGRLMAGPVRHRFRSAVLARRLARGADRPPS